MSPQSNSGQSKHDLRRKSRKRKRVEVRLQPVLSTPEGITLNYLLNNPVLNHREAVMRAVRAFYTPYAYRLQGLSQQELAEMLRQAIAELEFRKFQLCQDFAFAEPSDLGYAVPYMASNSIFQSRANAGGVVSDAVPTQSQVLSTTSSQGLDHVLKKYNKSKPELGLF